MTDVSYKSRIRVNIATSVKGVKTFDATVELIDQPIDVVLALSDRLVQELDTRYPAPAQ